MFQERCTLPVNKSQKSSDVKHVQHYTPIQSKGNATNELNYCLKPLCRYNQFVHCLVLLFAAKHTKYFMTNFGASVK